MAFSLLSVMTRLARSSRDPQFAARTRGETASFSSSEGSHDGAV